MSLRLVLTFLKEILDDLLEGLFVESLIVDSLHKELVQICHTINFFRKILILCSRHLISSYDYTSNEREYARVVDKWTSTISLLGQKDFRIPNLTNAIGACKVGINHFTDVKNIYGKRGGVLTEEFRYKL